MNNKTGICQLFILPLFMLTVSPGISQNNNATVEAEHYIVYGEENRFAGWPANCAAAIFQGDEIVVGFIEGGYELQDGHNLAEPYSVWIARSKDGGRSWKTSDPQGYVGDYTSVPDLQNLEKAINFKDPGFMMRIVGTGYHGAEDPRGHFFYSYDRGVNWKGPYRLNVDGLDDQLTKYSLDELTPRTDYVITRENECMLFLSARQKGAFGTDRLFCVKTTDGGLNFDFTGWVIKAFEDQDEIKVPKVDLYKDKNRNPYATQCRAVMSSSLVTPDGTLLSAIRRKYIVKGGTDKHWIDLYSSTDGGKSWDFRSKICDTGPHNGNPPAMETTADGRLCMVYGDRKLGTVNLVYSKDEGLSWEDPGILMQGFWSEDMEYNDLGYPRLFRRSDGKMVAVFYYSTRENPHHLRACIW